MKPSNTFFRNTIILSLVLLWGCAPVQNNIVSTQGVVQATNTLMPAVLSTSTATSIPATAVRLSCPKLDSNTKFDLPTDSNNFEISILNYLNSGGDPEKIEPVTSSQDLPLFRTAYADIDNDSLSEIVVITTEFYEDQASIRIYHCEQNDYRLIKSFAPQNMSFGIIELVTEIFSSEPPFVIVRAPQVAGWGQSFFAVGWYESSWQMLNLGIGTTPSEIALFDHNVDGIKEVFIQTRTAATPGGGISRVIIDTYSWNGKEFAYISSVMPPGSDRVHYLDDAESALKQGNPLLAVANYEIAARDSNLSSYPTTYELINKQTQLARPYQQAFAFFRIVAVWFYLDRPEVASEYIQEMTDAFPQGTLGNEFVLAAQEMSSWYERDSIFSSSCAKAISLLDTQYPNIVINHLGDWGVANPMYFSTSDICKFD